MLIVISYHQVFCYKLNINAVDLENSFGKEVLLQLRRNLELYKEWLKPVPGDPLALTIVKSFFKGLSALLLVALSPVVLVILFVAFLAAF